MMWGLFKRSPYIQTQSVDCQCPMCMLTLSFRLDELDPDKPQMCPNCGCDIFPDVDEFENKDHEET